MIRQFLREHLIWYILYIMMFVLFFISFYLYHLPMPYLFNSLSLSIIIEGDNIWKTDKKWLTFALSQVLDNAIKYSNPESKIIISIGEESIRIQDYGIGILEEDIPFGG